MRAVMVALMALGMGCATVDKVGERVDDLCIAGQIRASSAEWLNENPKRWKQHRDYQQPIKSGDRILNADCSDALKAVGEKSKKGIWNAVKRLVGIDG